MFSFFVLYFVMGYVYQFGEIAHEEYFIIVTITIMMPVQ